MTRDGIRRHMTIDINVPRLGAKAQGLDILQFNPSIPTGRLRC